MSEDKEKKLSPQELEEELERVREELDEKKQEFAVLQRAYSALSAQFNVLQEIQHLMTALRDEEKLLERIMDIVLLRLEVESGSIFLMDEAKEELYFAAVRGPKAEQVKGFRIKVGEGIAGWVTQQNEPVAMSDVNKDARFKRDISDAVGYEVRSVLCVPLRIRGKVIGCIEVLNKVHDDIFTSDDIELLQRIAHTAGLLLENVRWAQRAREAIHEKKEQIKEGIKRIGEKITETFGGEKVQEKDTEKDKNDAG